MVELVVTNSARQTDDAAVVKRAGNPANVSLNVLAHLDTLAQDRILGRVTASTGEVEDLTAAQVRTLLNVEDGADVTDAANVAAAGAVMDGDFSSNGLMQRTGAGTYTSKTAPSGDVVGTSDTQTLTNKTIALGSNTVTGLAQSGAGAPSGNADFIGQFYENTSNGDLYQAIDTGTGASDWELYAIEAGTDGYLLGHTSGNAAWRAPADARSDLGVDEMQQEFVIADPADGDYIIVNDNYVIGTVTKASIELIGGTTPTATVTFKIADDASANATNITGLASISASAAISRQTASAANTMAKSGTTDRQLIATFASTSGSPTYARITVVYTRS